MRETWEKQKSDFIEVTDRNNKKILINKKYITHINIFGGFVWIFIFNSSACVTKEYYEEIKEMLGL